MSKQVSKNHDVLYSDIKKLIEEAKRRVNQSINSGLTTMYWSIGKRINEEILKNNRAEYGQSIVGQLSEQLTVRYGRSFAARNLRRMIQFTEQFPDMEIVSTLSTQLSWSHFVELLPLEEKEKRYFYANKIAQEQWSVRHTRKTNREKVV